MLFNSIEFVVFLPIVFAIYWLLNKNIKVQNFLILAASYLFYGWWDWRFLSLIIVSSIVDFLIGIALNKTNDKKFSVVLLILSICVNLGILGYFKYANFFLLEFISAFDSIGITLNIQTLKIILPVGISFYTFQTLSYTIDVYRGNMQSTNNVVDFFAYVSFFPQLVAGPIERASNLLPQFESKRIFSLPLAKSGLRLILWGLFKKVVIADNCSIFVDNIFTNYEIYHGVSLIFGTILFAFQIYCDFSGYSDIAIGTARLFGFDLMRNFRYPYFSRDIGEFWRRWHISLSTWFRDYLYIPIGGSKGGVLQKIRNVLIIFIVSGLWHGANWTFVFWGFLNAIYFLPLFISNKNRNNMGEVAEGKIFASLKELMSIIITFLLTCIAWVYFRSITFSDANYYLFKIIDYTGDLYLPNKSLLILIACFVIVEWLNRSKECPLFEFKNGALRYAQYYFIIILIGYYGNFGEKSFIYFQF